MKKVAVVYHSGYGHTERQAKAVAEGATVVAGVTAQLVSVADVDKHWDDLAAADAIVFGAPTYMGSVSAAFKKFMDDSSKAWFASAWKDKLAAGFTNSGSQSGDKLNSLIQLMVFANQHGMLWASLGLMPGNNNSKGSVDDLNRLGSYSGAMSQSNVDQGAEGMLESDLKTAAHLGRRVAEAALRYSRP
ncbi:MAG: flavodoxin family protein [Rhodocyclaceae bacterium]|jgi:multimeric flavodoxin WrbA|nr:flavodoxin family protein [Rhodocyclaceae bacterium]MCO5097704.1 flavodoxin family protein [Rhodocyclaceae bacterium]